MAPLSAVQNIPNLLVSIIENGSQDHKSLLAFYKLFDRHLIAKKRLRPVVVLSDGHSSHFHYTLLRFLREKEIHLYISPPDTTGVTQLLDQINKALHEHYANAKENLFNQHQTINREAFMLPLASKWDKWATPESIHKAGKKVGITNESLNVAFMQSDKFHQASMLAEEAATPNVTDISTILNSKISSSISMKRKDSKMYWKEKASNWKEKCFSLQTMITD